MSNQNVVFTLSVGDVKISRLCRRRWAKPEPVELTDDVEETRATVLAEMVKELQEDIAKSLPGMVAGLLKKLENHPITACPYCGAKWQGYYRPHNIGCPGLTGEHDELGLLP